MPLHRRATILAVAAVILAGLAGLGAYAWLEQIETDLRAEMQGTHRTRPVVVVEKEVQAGTAITAESVRVVLFPTEAVPEGSFDDPVHVIGRIALTSFRRNEPISDAKLAPTDMTRGGIASLLTGKDKRAMAVPVDEVVAVAGFIQPGDRVDVVATLHTDEEKSRPVTKIIVEDVPVLATGTPVKGSSRTEPAGREDGPRVMTLEVSPQEAEKVSLAASEGRIQLVLRHPLNGAKAGTDGATVEGLLGYPRKDSVPVPTRFVARATKPTPKEDPRPGTLKEPAVVSAGQPLAAPVSIVEVIRGLQRSEVRFAPTPQSEPADDPIR
jgi:pilus assembly protein CpaB